MSLDIYNVTLTVLPLLYLVKDNFGLMEFHFVLFEVNYLLYNEFTKVKSQTRERGNIRPFNIQIHMNKTMK